MACGIPQLAVQCPTPTREADVLPQGVHHLEILGRTLERAATNRTSQTRRVLARRNL